MNDNIENPDLLQGIAAARAGDKENARQLLVRGLQQDKDNLEGWLWLARITDDPSFKRRCINVVLRLDPHNLEARFLQTEMEQPTRAIDEEPEKDHQGEFHTLETSNPAKPSADVGADEPKPSVGKKKVWMILGISGALFTCLLCVGIVFAGYQLGWWGDKTDPEQKESLTVREAGSSNLYVEYILDASGSMNEPLADGVLKADAAVERLTESLKTYRPEASVGLRVYGHRIPSDNAQESCQDIELVAPVAPGYQGTMIGWLENYQALGMTPIASALQQAAADFDSDPLQTHSVVLISDGLETCGGDPCALVHQLETQGIRFVLHVIALNVDEPARDQLSCIAQAGGGTYQDVTSSDELKQALDQVQEEVIQDAEVIEPEPTPAAQALFEGQIAYIGPDGNVYVITGSGLTPIQITADGNQTYQFLRWSPDGQRLAFLGGYRDPNSYEDPLMTLYLVTSGESQPQAVLTEIYGIDWLPGSNQIYYGSRSGSANRENPSIGILDLDSGATSAFYPANPSPTTDQYWGTELRFMEFSPDGNWALVTDRVGPSETWFSRGVYQFPANVQTSTGLSDGFFDWSPEERQLAITAGKYGPGSNFDAIYITTIGMRDVQEIYDCGMENNGCIQSLLWTPQGDALLFGTADITLRINPDGSGLQNLTNAGIPAAWSPNGTHLLLYQAGQYKVYDPASGETLFEFAAQESRASTSRYHLDWGPLPGEAPAAQPEVSSSLSIQQIYNMQWSLPLYGDTPLYQGPSTNGQVEQGDILEGNFFISTLAQIVFGDLNGDGQEDAAIIVTENFGGSGFVNSLVVITNQGGEPVFSGVVSELEIAAKGPLEGFSIQNGQIIIDGWWYAPGDANCCPTQRVTRVFQLTGNGLEAVN